jgi:hypothetical protein
MHACQIYDQNIIIILNFESLPDHNQNIIILTPYMVDQKSILNPMVQAARLCSMISVNTADCAPPIKLIHAVSDS